MTSVLKSLLHFAVAHIRKFGSVHSTSTFWNRSNYMGIVCSLKLVGNAVWKTSWIWYSLGDEALCSFFSHGNWSVYILSFSGVLVYLF